MYCAFCFHVWGYLLTLSKFMTIYQKFRAVEFFFLRSWWVILFILCCYLCYEQGLKKRDSDFAKLHHQFLELTKEKALVSAQQENLLLQVNSQSDPEWIELILMRGLGLVSEGQTKVIFVAP